MSAFSGVLPTDANGNPIQVTLGNGTRQNLTAGVASSNATVPAGCAGQLVLVRATDYIWMNFGTSAAVAASAATTSQLVAPGEGVYAVPTGTTHVAVLRVGAADVTVQLETVSKTHS